MRSDAKGPRLWLRKDERKPEWLIRDGKSQQRTGCGPQERNRAEMLLADYIAAKHQPARSQRSPDAIPVADVLSIYLEDVAPRQARPQEVATRAKALLAWWGGKMLSQVTGSTCRAYADSRGAPAAARRELEDLRAAINHHRAEKLCSEVITVTLPPKSMPRERWLTRSEAARLLWTAYRRAPHLARFILVALYTGSRAGVVCAASYSKGEQSAWVDLDAGVLHRREDGAIETKKHRPPVALSGRLLAHLRRWKRTEPKARYVVEWNGTPVLRVTKAFSRAVEAAGLAEGVTPHVLRHTAATWLMQAGVEPWQASGLLGMSVDTLLTVYGHHHPGRQKATADLLARGRRPEPG